MESRSLRMAVLVPSSHKSLFSCQCMQTTERWQGKLRTCQRCVRNCKSESIWTTLYRSLMKFFFFWMYSTSSTCQERNWYEKRENCPRSWSAQEQSPKYITAWSHDMEGHARKCIERCCELSRKTIAQRSFHIVFGRLPPETRRSGNCCRISRDLVSGSIDMLVFSKNWKTRSTLDSWLLGRISHKVERSMRSSIGTSHQLYPSHYQLQTLLSRWKSSNGL